jgi:hypothetical protein
MSDQATDTVVVRVSRPFVQAQLHKPEQLIVRHEAARENLPQDRVVLRFAQNN